MEDEFEEERLGARDSKASGVVRVSYDGLHLAVLTAMERGLESLCVYNQ